MESENKEKIIQSFYNPEMEFEIKNDLYKQLEQTESSTEEQIVTAPLFEKICETIAENEKQQKRKKMIRLMTFVGSRAAIFILGMLISVVALQPYFSKKTNESEIRIIADNKSISQTILPDGSTVFLNANSELTYKLNSSDKREVFLKGEGWFKVTKMPEKPFIVHAGQYKVAVHGTVFNVKAYPQNKEVITTLQEGSIEILPESDISAIKPTLMIPGQQFTFNKEKKQSSLTTVQADLASVWKEAEVRFENKNFRDLLKILESKYNVQFEVNDPSLFKYHYDGSIRNENIIQVLNLIKETLPIKYQLVSGNVIMIEKQP
ncbi:DUF4974 domain-containing protein [Solitalea sp. MAHUQ-68]|uniref:DUF4974 domain-containing protein n=1 Tax=Solitalea agri TaxID=2953739 RepID=A0A9X2JCJ4_9SPHI|nr:FecR domain-containing protein [Solitalea agri]MCO4293542.1 DUF4974 domain-containing protein [Solitalea agri]